MTYFTLDEAAQYATSKTGKEVKPADLLRAGVLGYLLVCAPFGSGQMYNATKTKNEDFRPGMLIIPPLHLLEIETEGKAFIKLGHSLDHQIYFPQSERTRDQLRVMIAHLDKFIPCLIDKAQQADAPAPKVEAKRANEPKTQNKLRRGILDSVIEKAIEQAGNKKPADVYLKLKELALAEEGPFTGIVIEGSLSYTDSNDRPQKLTKEALAQRLKRRR